MTHQDSRAGAGPEGRRRFTDSEVALVLRKAAEIEEATGSGPGAGLSLSELQDIGKEVGISPEAIAKAVEGMDRRGPGIGLLAGAPLVRRSVYSVDGELSTEAIGRLIRLIDEKADDAGEVSEALGSVRWTSRDRFHGTQISITPENGETTIQVVEKALPRIRRILHLVPTAWGGILAGTVLSGVAAPDVGLAVIAVVLGLGGGATAGRLVWSWLSARSRDRVERLAAELSQEARESARRGEVTQPDEAERS